MPGIKEYLSANIIQRHKHQVFISNDRFFDTEARATFTLRFIENQQILKSPARLDDSTITQLPNWCLEIPGIEIDQEDICQSKSFKKANSPIQAKPMTAFFTQDTIIMNFYLPGSFRQVSGKLIYKLIPGDYELKY
ncbi:MAG: hypothetical protein QME49_08685, partial [bacterium]|nr:hypothetical protein [bacterium]